MLRVEGLKVNYGDFVAVADVSMQVKPGQVVALIGANGTGKSSLLSAVAGLIRPSAGRVLYDGEDVTGLSADRLCARGLSLVPQGGRCFQRMSVQDNLLCGSYPKGIRRKAKASLERVYGLFPVLFEKRRESAGSLSGGQRQMLAIGRALMARPRCVLFDEISLGLAPVAINSLYDCIAEINREEHITAVLVEQDTSRALDIADYCFVMLKGAISMEGRPDELSADDVKRAYFGVEMG